MTLPQIPIRLGRAEIPILWLFQLSKRGRKQGKHVLDFSHNPSWNLLKICLIKFVDTL